MLIFKLPYCLFCMNFVIHDFILMSTILINCSNLKKGGGLQVADSICCDITRFTQHRFVIVLSSHMQTTSSRIKRNASCIVKNYDSNNGLKVLLTGRDTVLDKIVTDYGVDVVLSIFGPISWKPRCPHLCGFARPHIVLQDSPYFSNMSFIKRIREKLFDDVLAYFFRRGVNVFFTESAYISEKWQAQTKGIKVYTVTNYYNQIFDHPEDWERHLLPSFDGCTILSITGYYPHKNLEIAIDVAKNLRAKHPDFRFRFVFTIEAEQYPTLDEDIASYFYFIGRTDISEAPSLYQQATIMFQPSLLECFSATYPESMRMNVPIVTADMGFARSLCGEAAIYYAPLDAEEAAKAIFQVATDEELRVKLVANGKKQLLQYDTYEQRTNKLVDLAVKLAASKL